MSYALFKFFTIAARRDQSWLDLALSPQRSMLVKRMRNIINCRMLDAMRSPVRWQAPWDRCASQLFAKKAS